MFKNVLLSASGKATSITPSNGTDFTLKEAQKMVGGYIELLETSDGKSYIIMNEEGKLKNLPHNRLATDFCNVYTVYAGRNTPFVGDVMVVDKTLFN